MQGGEELGCGEGGEMLKSGDKLFAVSKGSYSDYRVVGIFTTRKKAQKFIDAFDEKDKDGFSWSEYNDIEEYVLDFTVSEIERGLRVYEVRFDVDGNVQQAEASFSTYEIETLPSVKRCEFNGWVDCRVWAKDKKHAVKIASDMRRMEMAKPKVPDQE